MKKILLLICMTIGVVVLYSCTSKGHEHHEWYVGKTLASYDFESGYKLSFSFKTDSTCYAYFGNDYYDDPEEDEVRQSRKEMITYTIEEKYTESNNEFFLLKLNHWGETYIVASYDKDTLAKYGVGPAVFSWEGNSTDIELNLE